MSLLLKLLREAVGLSAFFAAAAAVIAIGLAIQAGYVLLTLPTRMMKWWGA